MTASFAQFAFPPQHPVSRTASPVALSPVIALTFLLAMIASAALPALAADKPLPPNPEIAAAEAALARAESADAQQYAADVLLRARATLGQAQAKWAERRKPDAIALAQLAAAEADYAYARSREATVQSDLRLRRAEIRELRTKLEIEQDAGGRP